MRENIFLNNNEMVSVYWVDVEIGPGAGDFPSILNVMLCQNARIFNFREVSFAHGEPLCMGH
jgi:hypothetical protein